ncbi:MAG: hypothetical protein ACTSPI_10550, partial [Candidatus Heimdallarchaeaceae archaeon]
MKTKTLQKIVVVIGVLVLFALNSSVSAEASTANSTTPSMKITAAYYCDVDNDGKQDDIVAYATFTSGEGPKVYFLIYTLHYPSGNTYTNYHQYYTNDAETTFIFTLTNAATEEGWYTFELGAYLIIEGNIYYLHDTL